MTQLIKDIRKDNNFKSIHEDNIYYRFCYQPIANKPTFITIYKDGSQPPFIDFEEDNHNYNEKNPILLSSIPLKKDIDIVGVRCVGSILGNIHNVEKMKLFNQIGHLHEIIKNPLDHNLKNKETIDKMDLIKEQYDILERKIGYENYYDALMLLTALKKADIDIIKPHIDQNVTKILERTFNKSVLDLTDSDVALIKMDKLYTLARMENEKSVEPQHIKIENAICFIEHNMDDILKHIPKTKAKSNKKQKTILKHI